MELLPITSTSYFPNVQEHEQRMLRMSKHKGGGGNKIGGGGQREEVDEEEEKLEVQNKARLNQESSCITYTLSSYENKLQLV